MAAPISANEQQTIPSAWPERTLKRDFEVVLGKMLQSEQAQVDESEQLYLRSANIQWGRADVSDVKTMWFSPKERRGLRLQSGDLLVTEGGDVGRCALWNGELPECYFQNSVNRIRPRKRVSTRFLYYWLYNLKHAGFIDAIVSRITIAHLTAEKLERVPWAEVPPADQEQIAAYLDVSCATIDAAVITKRRQLETLDALRRTVIQESVTKGLDPNVEMKDSGIDWLPEIPKNWDKAKLKRHVEMIRGQFTIRPRNDPAFYDGPYPFIQTGSISAADKFITEFTQTLNEDGLRISKLFPADTVVMTITGAKIAEVAVTTFEACFPDSIVGFVPDHHLNRDYLYYLLVAMKPALLRAMVVTTQPNINYVQIGGNYIPLPPVREQESIAKHIEQRVLGIRKIQKSLNEQIETLIAYRKSLIHECVTGQRRVTEADLKHAQSHA
ncbi:MAG: restriction endonuclease subunit S [Pyrinomonadaceae bacterium]